MPVRLRLAARVVAVLGLLLLLVAPFARAADPGTVVVLPTTGIVDQVMAGYLRDGIAAAAAAGAPAVVIELDTPGGSLDATHDIVQTLLGAPLPVIVWVAPAGARAASAGTFITLAGQPRGDGAGHQHRRRVAGRQRGPGHRRHAGRQGHQRCDRVDHGHRGRTRPTVDWAVDDGPRRGLLHRRRGTGGGRRRHQGRHAR